MKAARVTQRQQQLRDLAACLRSHAAEIEGMTTGYQTDDAEDKLLGLQSHITYMLQVLAPKGK